MRGVREELYELALFAGAGGGLLGSRLLGWKTVCYIEHNPYRVEVLKARIKDGCLDEAPIWDNVQTFDGHPWAGLVDIVTAGFPCQPWSQAGKHRGELDERNLWPDTIRVIREVRPRWALLENVPNILSRSYVRRIFGDLAQSGYDARWDCISAKDIGAPHLRRRIWIVAHSSSESRGLLIQPRQDCNEIIRSSQTSSNSKHNTVLHNEQYNIKYSNSDGISWWKVEPELGRVAYGVAHRMERLEAIGDGQVPGVARSAWLLLNEWRDECAA